MGASAGQQGLQADRDHRWVHIRYQQPVGIMSVGAGWALQLSSVGAVCAMLNTCMETMLTAVAHLDGCSAQSMLHQWCLPNTQML
jgi:hypothetical protein